MHGRNLLRRLLLLGIFLVILATLVVPAAHALPSNSVPAEATASESIDHDVAISTVSRISRIFGEWSPRSRVQMIAEISKPHIRRWHTHRRYRGVHH